MNAEASLSPFEDLRWYRLRVELINTRVSKAMRAHPLSVFQAIVKAVSALTFTGNPNLHEPVVFFHIPGKRHTYTIREGALVPLSILFFQTDETMAREWARQLITYFSEQPHNNNFRIAEVGEPECRRYADAAAAFPVSKSEGEIALEFMTPLPFKQRKKSNRTYLDKVQFVQLFEKRFSRLFARRFHYNAGQDAFEILPYYWKYTQIKHPSLSQAGGTQYINGCFGPLYIKGSFQNFLPFLILGSEVHTGAKISNAQGYYIFRNDPPGFFCRFFPQRQALISVIKDVLARYDEPADSPESAGRLVYNEAGYAEQLYGELAGNTYCHEPNTAFRIKKKDGTERIVEKLSTKDHIVHQYLLHTISRPFDRFFEEGSIGFRKGISREKAVGFVQDAVSKGFQYVIESDIEDFFPSVDLKVLKGLIDFYLPGKDTLLKELLCTCISADFMLDGKPLGREKGLAQGSPLSPILANLYLDTFDEQTASWGVKMIRYADDFVILARTRDEAEHILSHTESCLSEIGLQLKKEKTCIKPVSEGFHFLGMQFEKSAATVKPEEAIKRLRKPLYITEHFMFLALNGEAIDIYRNRTVAETIPLRRISEIIVMVRATFSTALLRYCVEHCIPVTVTLETGYFITTIKPDSKKFFEISAAHAQKFHQLTDTERLAIAKDIAASKLLNYLPVFKQRYTRGTNEIIREIEEYAERIHQGGTLDEIRGIEGITARKMYQWLNDFIEDNRFRITKRHRKCPDKINSLLNFGYYLLFSRLNATVRTAGLNPYLGLLHSPEDNYESLVSDFVELFRSRIDRFILRMLNLKIIGLDDFTQTKQGMYLKREAAKRYVKHFETELEQISGEDGLSLKERMYMQIILFRNWILDKGPLILYRWKE